MDLRAKFFFSVRPEEIIHFEPNELLTSTPLVVKKQCTVRPTRVKSSSRGAKPLPSQDVLKMPPLRRKSGESGQQVLVIWQSHESTEESRIQSNNIERSKCMGCRMMRSRADISRRRVTVFVLSEVGECTCERVLPCITRASFSGATWAHEVRRPWIS
ncbi:hypothetical protein GCK32_010944 [Trichostrongylus colubriformis]|uniref:Uncharacterized protein n=1 Tax=Trichostrongylus colubriformis TaxID=6319 RepID=A0AAN8G4D6_TRICO